MRRIASAKVQTAVPHERSRILPLRREGSPTVSQPIDYSQDLLPEIDRRLLPVQAWDETSVPPHERGIRMQWLFDFVKAIDDGIAQLWRDYYGTKEAAEKGPWGLADPIPPRYPFETMSTNWIVSEFIKPLTQDAQAPLYARVPPEYRGKPTVFVSHTWASTYFAGGHGSLDIAYERHRDQFVWIDIGCYNQHLFMQGDIAADMKDLIDAIGHVSAVLTTQPFFSRSWCIWELVSAHDTGATYQVQDQIARIKRKYFTSETGYMPPKFNSIADLTSSVDEDRRDIFQQLLTTFGSVEAADRYIEQILAHTL
jgi:hypothetical protein